MALNPKQDNWRGKTVWLVGASTGIGRSTASALHALGARVIVSARHAKALDDFVLAHPGNTAEGLPTAVALPLDVSIDGAVQAAAQIILKDGPIDCAMYCAGTYKELRATEFNLPEMLHHQRINYLGRLRWPAQKYRLRPHQSRVDQPG
jgi:NAD(P)-dependent dehydrogenase (short-subunit alcohol dehydrogenase family)